MALSRLDHVAIEVADFDALIERLVATGGMRLLRRGTARRTGARMAMVGDPTGMKLELIENPEAHEPRYLHVAFRSNDVDGALDALTALGWQKMGGPNDLPPAEARTGRVKGPDGFELQVLTYQPTSPDVVEWAAGT